MNLKECKTYIDKVLRGGKGESFDICDYLYQGLNALSPADQPVAFQYICEQFGTVESSDSFGISPSKYRNKENLLRNQLGHLVNSLIELYIKRNVEENEFYISLWNNIMTSGLFLQEEEKIFALYYVIIDKRIPYFHLDPASLYSLSNERFQQITNENITSIQKIRFILKASFSQKTERASVLLAELGINAPQDTSDTDSINLYETKLIKMVEIVKNGNDVNLLKSLIGQVM